MLEAYGYDSSKNKLIILFSVKDEIKSPKHVKIVDLNGIEPKVIYHNKIFNPELIGRLTSMLYSFVDGHIYYNNKVIKIRYDVLEKSNNKEKNNTESKIFNYYTNLLHFAEETDIQNGLPVAH